MWIGDSGIDFLECYQCGNKNPFNLNTVSVDMSGIFIHFYCDQCKTIFYRYKSYSPVRIESAYI